MINLLRNRELRLYLLGLAGLGLAGFGICFALCPPAAGVAGAVYLALMALTVAYTRWRYRRIAELSDCLGRIAAGDYSIDLREYRDGELSILKSELYKVTRTLSHQAQRLQADKRFLADSISDISHQLKTPLTAATTMTELLGDPGLPAHKREEFLVGIRSGLDRIQWLIASLLKLSRLDAGAVTMRADPVAMEALVEQAAAPLRIAMEVKGQRLTTEGAPGVAFTGDLPWMAEAVGNLLKNCVEHTPAGGHIGLRWEQTPLHTRIAVFDNGPGIDPADLPHLFRRFYRGKNTGTDSVGIGLALSKSIVSQNGGVIEAANRPEGGACFTIRLYKDRGALPKEPKAPCTPPPF